MYVRVVCIGADMKNMLCCVEQLSIFGNSITDTLRCTSVPVLYHYVKQAIGGMAKAAWLIERIFFLLDL